MKKILVYTALFSCAFLVTSNNAMERFYKRKKGKQTEQSQMKNYVTVKVILASTREKLSSMVVSGKTTVADIKQMIASEYGYPVHKQHLSILETHDIGGKFQTIPSRELPNHALILNIINKYNSDMFMLEIR